MRRFWGLFSSNSFFQTSQCYVWHAWCNAWHRTPWPRCVDARLGLWILQPIPVLYRVGAVVLGCLTYNFDSQRSLVVLLMAKSECCHPTRYALDSKTSYMVSYHLRGTVFCFHHKYTYRSSVWSLLLRTLFDTILWFFCTKRSRVNMQDLNIGWWRTARWMRTKQWLLWALKLDLLVLVGCWTCAPSSLPCWSPRLDSSYLIKCQSAWSPVVISRNLVMKW